MKTVLNVVDRSTLAYNVIVLALILVFHARIPDWPLRLLPNVGMLVAALVIVYGLHHRTNLGARLIRYFYPMVFFPFMYEQTGNINHILYPGFLDSFFQRIELAVFGVQPAIMLAQWFPQRWLAELLHAAYFSYYLLFTGLGVFLYLRRSRREFFDYMLALCGTMYVCYMIYICLPVRGALCFGLGDAPGGGPFSAVMGAIYRHGEVEGAAFPSSHVAIATVVLVYTFRYARPAIWVIGPLVVALIVATVYCRYHYAIDVFAGLATTALLVPLWRRINTVGSYDVLAPRSK